MSDADRLRDLLERTAPDQPDLSAPDRAAAVARRGRSTRRRDRALVVGAVVALAAVVAVPVALQRSGPGEPDTATPPAVSASPCPERPVDVTRPGTLLDLGDVVAVRACPADSVPGDRLPAGPLEGPAAEAFAADVEALPAYRLPAECAFATALPQPWALQVQTADGTTYLLGSTMRTCSALSIGGVDRGVDGIVAAFEGNLDRQQAGAPTELACPKGERLADGTPTWNASFDLDSATAGLVCSRADPLGTPAYLGFHGRLDPDQLTTVLDDLGANLRPRPDSGMCTDTGPQRLLVLADGDGDQVAFVDDRCRDTFASAQGSWKPGPAAEDAIADALGGRVSR